MMSSRRKADLVHQDVVGAGADGKFPLRRFRLTLFVECHHYDGRAVAKDLARLLDETVSRPPSADGIDDGLALHHLQPRLDDAPFDESIITGTRAMSGSAATSDRKRRMAASEIDQPLVHVHVDDLRAVLDLAARHFESGVVIVGRYQLAEFCRARDVGPLADIDEIVCGGERERLEAGEAQESAAFRERRAALPREPRRQTP